MDVGKIYCIGMNWIQLAQYMVKWQVKVKAKFPCVFNYDALKVY
jgi:hypothetical protein